MLLRVKISENNFVQHYHWAANTYKSNSDHKQKLTRMMFPFLLHKEFLRVFGVIQN